MDPLSIRTVFSFLFGLALGSFLNVCIYRIPRQKSLMSPPSSCPHCGKGIRFYDNIPLISYIILLGKCRYCRKPISLRYPVVELTTGLLSAALFIRHGITPPYFFLLVFASLLVVISFIDLDFKIIPDVLSLPGIPLGFIAAFLFAVNQVSWLESLIGILGGGGFFYLIGAGFRRLRGKEGMGGGDIKLLAMIGAWMGWKALPFIVLISSLTGTLIGGGALLMARRGFSEKIPYGPFLVLGTLVYLFFGAELRYLWYAYLTQGI
ncbi:MAG: prepilin peptidase [Deltaproteobacteria bacterium]|nr:prepilin peptidase [Deltaproteobacteria bacterium]